jgi:DNA segregation ATPase FtsK/SpoIIIE-like protein
MKPGERLNKIQKIAEDLQRELATDTVPLVDNVSGEPFVGIDLPRPESAIAQLDEELHRVREHEGELPFLVGVSPDGKTNMADLATLPHLLVAGSTGSGKTIFLYSVILSLIRNRTPETLKTILVDPKQTDFIYFDDLPHLLSENVIIEPTEAIDWLRYLMNEELQKRTKLLREARARNITDYNRDKTDSEALPYIVVAIDEYADLVHTLSGSDRDEFERQLVRLAQRARNVGIHLVIATQRPSADIVTTRLKTNLPARVAFRLPSHHDSSTILDRPGAEKLIGKGDMLALMEGDLQRLQGFYVSPERLEELVLQRR